MTEVEDFYSILQEEYSMNESEAKAAGNIAYHANKRFDIEGKEAQLQRRKEKLNRDFGVDYAELVGKLQESDETGAEKPETDDKDTVEVPRAKAEAIDRLEERAESLDATVEQLGLVLKSDYEAITEARKDLVEEAVEATGLEAEELEATPIRALSAMASETNESGAPDPKSGDVQSEPIPEEERQKAEELREKIEHLEGHDGKLVETQRKQLEAELSELTGQ